MGWDLLCFRHQRQWVQYPSSHRRHARWALDMAQPGRPPQPRLMDRWCQHLGARREADAPRVVQPVHHDLLGPAGDC